MANDLVSLNDIPGYAALVAELEKRLFESVKSWEDFEWRFLRGIGLAANTYSNMRSGLKQFFDSYLRMRFSPFRVTAEMIEAYYDFEMQRNSAQTASTRISQLRRFFTRFCADYPICKNPFVGMDSRLVQKFAQPRHVPTEKRFLRRSELEMLFEYLRRLGETEPWLYFMMVLTKFLFFTGLRVGETIQLRFKDLERFNDSDGKWKWRCWFIPKGGRDFTFQKMPESCYHEVVEMHRRRFKRDPLPDDIVWPAPSPRYYKSSKRKSPRLSGPEAAGLYQDLTKLVNESGLFDFKVKLHPHFFRHNLAMYLRTECKWDARDIQLILRHTSLDTTTVYYFHDHARDAEEFEF
jgi:integrase